MIIKVIVYIKDILKMVKEMEKELNIILLFFQFQYMLENLKMMKEMEKEKKILQDSYMNLII